MILLAGLFAFSSCKKEAITDGSDEATIKEETLAFSVNGTIFADLGASATDSIYVMEACPKGSKKGEVIFSALPDSVEAYLSANYSGYTRFKAFKITDIKSELNYNYVVLVRFNDKPVALKFDADGAFVKVLELREKADLKGKGWHLGGWFEHRNRSHKDTIAISSLSASIQLYFTSSFPQDSLLFAVKNKEGAILVLSENNGFFATAFTSTGVFIKRVTLPSFPGKTEKIGEATLSAKITAYLETTYPNYVLKQAFAVKQNGVLKGYVVIIDANLTKYALKFDASGSFKSSLAIR